MSRVATDLWLEGGSGLIGLGGALRANGVYAGIDRATEPEWAANEFACGGPLTIDALKRAYDACATGLNSEPDGIWTTYEIFEQFRSEFAAMHLDGASQNGDITTGWEVFFRGMPVYWTPKCPLGEMYFLNSDHLSLAVLKPDRYGFTGFERAPNRLVQEPHLTLHCQLITDRPASMAKITGITA